MHTETLAERILRLLVRGLNHLDPCKIDEYHHAL